MDLLSETELWEWVVTEGLNVDMGYVAGGPFVDDGTVRIYDNDFNVLAAGDNLSEAVENYRTFLA